MGAASKRGLGLKHIYSKKKRKRKRVKQETNSPANIFYSHTSVLLNRLKGFDISFSFFFSISAFSHRHSLSMHSRTAQLQACWKNIGVVCDLGSLSVLKWFFVGRWFPQIQHAKQRSECRTPTYSHFQGCRRHALESPLCGLHLLIC